MHNESLSPSDPFNQSLKKSILWNAVEPGDPYDIKKSMIAKLPGDKKIFLGNKLEIVCLLQAAEIERLALNLQEYKVKLRQVEKSDLDRHSYQIQIKELASRLQNEQSIRNQNTKLKNFIDRLNQQLQQNKQRVSVGNNQLNIKYQQALLQIQTITDHNTQLNNESANIRKLLQGKSVQLSQAESTIRELREELNRYIEEQGRMSDYEDKFTLLGKQIERLNLVLKGKTSDIQSLNEQISQYEDQLHREKEENKYLINNQLKLNEEINSYKLEMKKSKHEEDQYKYKEYQSRIEASNKEINSLNIRFSNERSQFQSQCERLKAQNDQVRSIIQELEAHIQELEDQNQKYEDNSSIIARQIERLNSVLKSKIDEINSLQSKNNRITEENQFYIQQLSLLEKESAQLKNIHRKMQELQFELSKQQAAKERLAKINSDLLKRQTELDQSTLEQFEIRIGHLNEDIKRYQLTIEQYQEKVHRLNENINVIQNQNKIIKEKVNEGEYTQQQLRKVTRDLSDLKNLMVQEDIGKKGTQERMNDLIKKSIEYQKLISQLSGQIQRLNEILKAKLQETTILENKMQYLSGQNHRLQGEYKSREGKVQDYQNKFALVSLEVQRLNNNLMLKVQQNTELEQQINSWKKENAKLKQVINEINYKSNQNIQEINEQMRRQLYQKDEELNKLRANQAKFSELLIEWQKLNQIMKQKQEEIKEKDTHLYRLQSECETLKLELRDSKNRQKEISDLQRLNNLLRLKVEEAARWQSSNHQLIKNNEFIQTNLDNSLHQINELKRQLHLAKNENISINRQLNQYRDKFNQILREFQRLQQMLDTFRKAERQKYAA